MNFEVGRLKNQTKGRDLILRNVYHDASYKNYEQICLKQNYRSCCDRSVEF
jgi:hypothetical protein